MKCTNHEILEKIPVQIFYRELDELNMMVANNAVGGSIIKKSYSVTTSLLNQVTN